MKQFFLVVSLLFSVIVISYPISGPRFAFTIRDGSNVLLSNRYVSLKLNIIDSSATGHVVYSELQSAKTDSLGLLSLIIGQGMPTFCPFTAINWMHNGKWIEIEIDTTTGRGYKTFGSSMFFHFPYAMYACSSKSEEKTVEFPDGMQNSAHTVFWNSVYTVPEGKNLYLDPRSTPLVVLPNDTIKWEMGSCASPYCLALGVSENQTITGLMKGSIGNVVNKSVQWITQNIAKSPLNIPVDKDFILVMFPCLDSINEDGANSLLVDGRTIVPHGYSLYGAGKKLSVKTNGKSTNYIITGYFIDRKDTSGSR